MTFDITNLIEYDPPQWLCQKCKAINEPVRHFREEPLQCRACNLRYNGTQEFPAYQFDRYAKDHGLAISWKDPIADAKHLAHICRAFDRRSETIGSQDIVSDFTEPLISHLLDAFLAAEHFVHVVSYGISHQFIGILKLISRRVSVRVVISAVDAPTARELTEFNSESRKFESRIFSSVGSQRKTLLDVPHQKLVIIDGLMAFKGAANLTLSGWRKADKGLDTVEVVTSLEEVRDLNNKYFSPIWGSDSEIEEEIEMVSRWDF